VRTGLLSTVWTSPWDVVFLAGFVVYVVIRGVFEQRTKGLPTIHRRLDAGERLLLALVAVGCLFLPLLRLFTPWLAFADYPLPAAAPWCGTAVLVAGLWLFRRAHADLGLNWFVTLALREGHELVTSGVYGRIRHPMYAAIFLVSLGQGLLLANWLAGSSALVTFGLLYLVRTPREERMMLAHFGDAYRAYQGRTGRLVPRLGRVQTPS
jgi:protein-S-isoprenylcysteine O-methyltransferase Ste14